jgi:hypothetical protein
MPLGSEEEGPGQGRAPADTGRGAGKHVRGASQPSEPAHSPLGHHVQHGASAVPFVLVEPDCATSAVGALAGNGVSCAVARTPQ